MLGDRFVSFGALNSVCDVTHFELSIPVVNRASLLFKVDKRIFEDLLEATNSHLPPKMRHVRSESHSLEPGGTTQGSRFLLISINAVS